MKSSLSSVVYVMVAGCCLFGLLTSPFALLAGFAFAAFFSNPFPQFSKKSVSLFLKIAIILFGFGMQLSEAIESGKMGFLITVFSVFGTLFLGLFIGKWLGLDKKLAYLISGGTSICGGSAIAALSVVIAANEKQISIALSIVFLLNAIALLIFPSIGHFFDLSQFQFGIWAAIAIHDTSSVVGAGLEYGEEALKVATTIKLTRTLWIIPVSLVSLILFKSKTSKLKFPWFIGLFVLAILVNSYAQLPESFTSFLVLISKRIMILTLFMIGTGLTKEKVQKAGAKSLGMGFLLWLIVSISSLAVIIHFY